MKKFIFILLALQIISSGNFLSEIVKLNSLVDHFFEHESGKNPINMLQFIRLHYFDSKHENSDPKRHASLPLHHANTTLNIVCYSPIEQIHLSLLLVPFSENFIPINKGMMPQFKQVSVFQPPRFI